MRLHKGDAFKNKEFKMQTGTPKKISSALAFVISILLVTPSSHGQQIHSLSRSILFRHSGKSLRDSKWGKITVFQRALAETLQSCGKSGISPDGIFGPGTQKAIAALGSCQGHEDFAFPPDHPLHGTIHAKLWQKLLPDLALPAVHERAFVLSLSHEATDYDRVEWNYDTSDSSSVLTWGPYGATVGHGQEIQGILKKIQEGDPELLKSVFADEHPAVAELLQAGNGFKLLKPVYQDEKRRQLWREKFKVLGSLQQARDAYERYALETDRWFRPSLRRLYDRLIPDAKNKATEIDYAFFLDLAIHMTISKTRVEKTVKAIVERETELGRPLSPAERRQVISLTMIPSRQQKDRLGRNVVYYIDGLGEPNLSQDELNAWKQRTGRRTSDCGLSDERNFYPSFLQ
jgi:hypothetical protein